MADIYNIDVKDSANSNISMSEFAGKTLLIVNVASKCGLTPQYEGLQKLYDDYKDRDFVVLGFPCNQFGGQEPGSDQEIGNLADHRFLMVAKDAMGYQSLKDKRPIVQKKIAKAPKVVKSGVASSNVSSGREQIRSKIGKVRKSGNIQDAQSAILDIINLKSQQRK